MAKDEQRYYSNIAGSHRKSLAEATVKDPLRITAGTGILGSVAGGIGGGVAGAMGGAALGSVVPVVGTIIGGVLGFVAGAIGGAVAGGTAGGVVGLFMGAVKSIVSGTMFAAKTGVNVLTGNVGARNAPEGHITSSEALGEGQSGGVLGLAEKLLALAATITGFKAIKNKLFGGKGGEDDRNLDASAPASSGVGGRSAVTNDAQSRSQQLESFRGEDGQYHLTAEALADPQIRQALQERADYVAGWAKEQSAADKVAFSKQAMTTAHFSDPKDIVISDAQLTNHTTMRAVQGIGSDISAELGRLDKVHSSVDKDISRLEARLEKEADRALNASALNNNGALNASEARMSQWQAQLDEMYAQRDQRAEERTNKIDSVYADIAVKNAGAPISQFAPDQVINELRNGINGQPDPVVQTAATDEPAQTKGTEEGLKPSATGWAAPDPMTAATKVAEEAAQKGTLSDDVSQAAASAADRPPLPSTPPPPAGVVPQRSADQQRG